MDRQRAVPLFEESGCGRPYEPHSLETLITLGTLRIHRIWIQKGVGGRRDFQFAAPLHVCLCFWCDLCFGNQTDRKPQKKESTIVLLDKSETLSGSSGCRFSLLSVCANNNLLNKHTVNSLLKHTRSWRQLPRTRPDACLPACLAAEFPPRC